MFGCRGFEYVYLHNLQKMVEVDIIDVKNQCVLSNTFFSLCRLREEKCEGPAEASEKRRKWICSCVDSCLASKTVGL